MSYCDVTDHSPLCQTPGCKNRKFYATKSRLNPRNHYCKPCQARRFAFQQEQIKARREYDAKNKEFVLMGVERRDKLSNVSAILTSLKR